MTTLKTRPTEPDIMQESLRANTRAVPQLPPAVESTPASVADLLDALTGVELEAILGGALMRLKFGPGVRPEKLLEDLKKLDPSVQVRDAFPSKSFGNRESKTARAEAMNLRVSDSGTFIEIACIAPDGADFKVVCTKKGADTFRADLLALGKLSKATLDKIESIYADKLDKLIVLHDQEQFGVKYWTTDDGKKRFLDSLIPDPPAPETPASQA